MQLLFQKKMEYTPLPPLSKGDLLENGKYEIISDTEDAGGFGRIYRAKDRHRMKDVAIKEFHLNEIDDATMSYLSSRGLKDNYAELLLGQFKIEAQVMYDLSRQRDCHIPQIYHRFREDNGRFYYTMDWVDGITLTDKIKQDGPMDEHTAIGYIVQIAKVLHKAHAWKLIHNDISPNNIMLDHGFAVLVDFGNARGYSNMLRKIYDGEERFQLYDSLGINLFVLARFAEICESMAQDAYDYQYAGTPGFVSPVEYIGLPQSDIYSLAATLYFILIGKKIPCSLENAREILAENNVSDTTANAIMHALQSYLDFCTPSARDFLMELPQDIVFDTLLNYNDHDYNRRR